MILRFGKKRVTIRVETVGMSDRKAFRVIRKVMKNSDKVGVSLKIECIKELRTASSLEAEMIGLKEAKALFERVIAEKYRKEFTIFNQPSPLVW